MSRKRRSKGGKASIVFEVKTALDAIDKIGQSKRDAKKNNEKGIHSLKQKSNTMSDAQNFARWVRAEHGVRSIDQLTERHYSAYMAYMAEKGLSKGHRMNVETSLRLLQVGHQKATEGSQTRFEGFCPEERLLHYNSRDNVQNRAYERFEIEKIKEKVSHEVSKAIDLMTNLGLRVKEAVYVRVEHFVEREQGWQLKIKEGAGITKGGRHREIDVPKAFESDLKAYLQGKEPLERVINVSYSTVRDGVNVACKKAEIEQRGRGCHGFRHTYARERLETLATAEQRDLLQRIIDNRMNGHRIDKGIVRAEKGTYEEARVIMDKIQGELGHGADRWDLATRYLSV